MKKHGMTGWMLPALLLTLPVVARAQFAFTTNNGAITITGYTGTNGIATIPSSTNGYPVKSIGSWAFGFSTNLATVTIPTSVTNIGQYAFYDCASLTNVSVPSSITQIAEGTFYDCTDLPAVTLPNTVTSVGDGAFAFCYSLTNVALGSGLTNIGNEAFMYCSSLPGVTIPNSVKNIGDDAFAWCDSLTNVILGSGVTAIGDNAFQGTGLIAISIPASVLTIGDSPFHDCSGPAAVTVASTNAFYSSLNGVLFNKSQTTLLEYPGGLGASYTIPNSVTNIGDGAFLDCPLTNVIIPNSVTRIGNAAFSGTSLMTVTIPNSVTTIGDESFAWCDSLASATIGTGVNTMGNSVFYECSSLAAITVNAANPAFCSLDGVLYDKGTNVLIQCPEGRIGALVIPDSVTGIGSNALRFCASLTNVTIGGGVTNIALDAFSLCSSLASVTVGGRVTNIAYYSFYYCTNLLSVNFQGNAPGAGYLPFTGDGNVILYYLAGATGWTNTLGGRPAVLWGSSCPWYTVDVGAVGVYGTAVFGGGVFTSYGAGADITGSADAFRFVYLPVTGDFTIVARVTSVQNINAWSKAGVMFRESTNANSANVLIAVTPGNGVTWQYRTNTAGTTRYNNTAGLNAPYWVKLVRSTNTFTGYRSSDGTNWLQQGSVTNATASSAWIGLALTSHDSTTLCTATFDNVVAPGWPTSYPPPALASLTATAANAQASVSWAASSSAISYNLKRALTNGGPCLTVANVTTTNYTDVGLTNSTTYYYVVSALNLAGESTNSAPVSVTLPTIAPSIVLAATRTNLTLSWPLACAGFDLFSCTNLATGNWQKVTSPASEVISNQWQISIQYPIAC